MAERKGDPQKETMVGADASPQGEPDVAEDAAKAAAEEKAETKAEAKPKRARAKKKPAAKKGTDPSVAAEPETAEAEAAEAEEKPAKKPARRRGAAETTTAKPKTPARRSGDGTVIVRAQAKYVRTAPRKARLVIDHIRGKSVDDARAILMHTPRGASADVLKLLNSAIANAENNHELLADELKVHQAYVDEGPTLKRFRPRARGRAARIRKRTSHMTITLTPKD
jgi:ribosomal protein L22